MSKDFIFWCDFCTYLDSTISLKCFDCDQKYNLKPSNFEEKTSVTAYRKAIGEVIEWNYCPNCGAKMDEE